MNNINDNVSVNYRYNSKNELIIQDIIEFIRSFSYGSMIYYEDVAKRIGLNIDTDDALKYLKQLVGKTKNILIDYSYILKSVGGKGWYILKPTQIPSYTYRTYITKPQKAYEKAKRILERTDKSKYKDINHEQHSYVTELNNDMIQVSDYTIFNSNYYKNKDKYKDFDFDKKN